VTWQSTLETRGRLLRRPPIRRASRNDRISLIVFEKVYTTLVYLTDEYMLFGAFSRMTERERHFRPLPAGRQDSDTSPLCSDIRDQNSDVGIQISDSKYGEYYRE